MAMLPLREPTILCRSIGRALLNPTKLRVLFSVIIGDEEICRFCHSVFVS